MTEPNKNIHWMAEEDEFRNIDSMRPSRKVNHDVTPDRGEALPKTRRQRRLEQQGSAPVSVMPENSEYSYYDKELRKKAKAFSLMVFKDDSLDPENFSSLAMIPENDNLPAKKTWWSKKSVEEPGEAIDIHALKGHIESLLIRFLRDYKNPS